MRRIRLFSALVAWLILSAPVGAAVEAWTPDARARVRRTRFVLRSHPEAFATGVHLKDILRGYALTLEAQGLAEEAGEGYWLRAAEGSVRLAHGIAVALIDLDNRIGPTPAPESVRQSLFAVVTQLKALRADGSGDSDYWRGVAHELQQVLATQAAALHSLHDQIWSEAPFREVPGTLNLFHLGRLLVSDAPSGEGTEGYWRRCAENQVRLCRGLGLAVGGHVRYVSGPARQLLLEAAVALRLVRLGKPEDIKSWRQEALRLEALLRSHERALAVIADKLN